MKIYIKKEYLSIFKNNLIVIDELRLNNLFSIVKTNDLDIFEDLFYSIEGDKFYKYGLMYLLEESNKNFIDGEDITDYIVDLIKFNKSEINKIGGEIYNESYDAIINSTLLTNNIKMLLSSNNIDKIEPEVIFDDYPNINVLFLVDKDKNYSKVICRDGYEIYNKRIFNFEKQGKDFILLEETDSGSVINKYRNLTPEDIVDEKEYELEKLKNVSALLNDKDLEFLNELKEAFMDSVKEFFQGAEVSNTKDSVLEILEDLGFNVSKIKNKSTKREKDNGSSIVK